MTFDVDLFVIGGGSGGVRAARVASGDHGARVALAEESRMGGTCVIRGCVPKKLMVFASEYPEAMADARAYGWDVSAHGFDWTRFRGQLEAELSRLEGAYRGTLRNAGVTVHDTRATVEDAHSVRLATGERITARPHPDRDRRAALRPRHSGRSLPSLRRDVPPARAAAPGAGGGRGYIASEFACILQGLGVEVTQYYRGAQILRGFDDESRGHVANAMQARGIAIHCGTDVLRLERVPGGIRAVATDGSTREFDLVLYATGRRPNSAGLGWNPWACRSAGGAKVVSMPSARPRSPRSLRWAT